MNRLDMMNGLMALHKTALQNIAARAGWRAKPHSMNKRQLAADIVESYSMEKWLAQEKRDWIIECINECEKVKS